MDMVPELVGRFDGIIDGLRSLVEVARDSVGGVGGDVFDEVDPGSYGPGPTSVSAHVTRSFEPLIAAPPRGRPS